MTVEAGHICGAARPLRNLAALRCRMGTHVKGHVKVFPELPALAEPSSIQARHGVRHFKSHDGTNFWTSNPQSVKTKEPLRMQHRNRSLRLLSIAVLSLPVLIPAMAAGQSATTQSSDKATSSTTTPDGKPADQEDGQWLM